MIEAGITFSPCTWADIHEHVADYIHANNIIIDSFWEDHVIGSNHYIMDCLGEYAGFFAVHGGSTITLFHVTEQYANQSQELFSRVKRYESVTNAMVVTGDEMFISHCFDNYARIEKQAYFAVYTDKDIPAERQTNLQLRLADIDKDQETLKLSGDFFDGDTESIRNGLELVYIVELGGRVVGFGVIQYGHVVNDIASIGMYVCEEHRRQGIAANILRHLKHIAQDKGCKVVSGCWYYNHNSKKSMESAGAYSKTRLMRFYF